jgi:hypothetical protein
MYSLQHHTQIFLEFIVAQGFCFKKNSTKRYRRGRDVDLDDFVTVPGSQEAIMKTSHAACPPPAVKQSPPPIPRNLEMGQLSHA